MNIIEIDKLTYRYKNNFIYNNFSLNIEKGSWTTIAGANGSGKTTLVKILAGFEKSYNSIKVNGKVLNNKNIIDIRKIIGYCFDVPDNYFACETVIDEIAFSLENLGIMPKTIKKKIDDIAKLLNIEYMLNKNPLDLSGGEKQLVQIACVLIIEPRIIILDEALMMMDSNIKKNVLNVLKMYNNEKRVTIINFTHDLSECIYSDRLVVLNEGKILIDGSTFDCFEKENIMRKIGLEVPFTIEVINKLKLFNINCDLTFDMKELVKKLWI